MSSTVEVTGRTYKVLTDATNKIWNKLSFWTRSSDVYTNGDVSLQTALGNVTGISSSTSSSSTTTLATSKAVNDLNSNLASKVDGFTSGDYAAVTGLAYDSTNNQLGLKVGADTIIPFSKGSALGRVNGNYVPNTYVLLNSGWYDTRGSYMSYTVQYWNSLTYRLVCADSSKPAQLNIDGVSLGWAESSPLSGTYTFDNPDIEHTITVTIPYQEVYLSTIYFALNRDS